MHGLRRRGEEETDKTIKDRNTVDKGSLASGEERAFRGGGEGDDDRGLKRLVASTDEFEVLVRLTNRLVTQLAVCTRGSSSKRAAFIDVVAVIVSDEALEM